MHPVVKVLWMIGVGIILGSIFVSTVFHIYSDWYISLVLIAAALPIIAAVITDAYVRQLNNFKFKVIVCAMMLTLINCENSAKDFYVILIKNYVNQNRLCKPNNYAFFNMKV